MKEMNGSRNPLHPVEKRTDAPVSMRCLIEMLLLNPPFCTSTTTDCNKLNDNILIDKICFVL